MNTEFSIHFWGVRGSHPSPGPNYMHVGGNTACVEMRVGGQRLIFDAGTGLIPLGDQLLDQGETAPILLLLSHYHHDHIQGLPHFAPMYQSGQQLYIVAPWSAYQDRVWNLLVHASARATLSDRPELHSRRHTRLIDGGETLFWNSSTERPLHIGRQSTPPTDAEYIAISTYRSHAHPRGGSMCYRVDFNGKSAVFATDIEAYVGCDQHLIEFAQGADLIIHDAHFTPDEYATHQGWGHSTWEMAVDLARQAGISRIGLFHHDPYHPDELLNQIEATAQAVYPGTFIAREGVDISL